MKQVYTFFFALVTLGFVFTSCEVETSRDFVNVTGCSDPIASNFNPSVTFDDGTCTYAADVFAGAYEAIQFEMIFDNITTTWDTVYGEQYAFEIVRLTENEVAITRLGEDCVHSGAGFTAATTTSVMSVDLQNLNCTPGTIQFGEGSFQTNELFLDYPENLLIINYDVIELELRHFVIFASKSI